MMPISTAPRTDPPTTIATSNGHNRRKVRPVVGSRFTANEAGCKRRHGTSPSDPIVDAAAPQGQFIPKPRRLVGIQPRERAIS